MIEYRIDNPHKLEVDITRIPLTFHISTPHEINKQTIPVVVLHGYAEHSSSAYMKSLHENITKNYNIAIISVNYVGTFSKIKFGRYNKHYDFLTDILQLSSENKSILINILQGLYDNNQDLFSYLNQQGLIKQNSFENYKRTLHLLIYKLENDLCDGWYIIERLYEMGIEKSLVTFISETIGDHNDFGLIQAVDVLTAIGHIKNEEIYSKLNWNKLSIVGTSHGGFIASMCDKLAPNTFNKIVNNAGWIEAREHDIYGEVVTKSFLTLIISSTDNNYWSKESSCKNYFDINHKQIRELYNHLHIEEQYKQTLKATNKIYYFSHTINDHLIPLNHKDTYIKQIKQLYTTEYLRLDTDKKLDGKTFKSLDHGANVSIKGLIIDFIINNKSDKIIEKNDFDRKSIIKYTCDNGTYTIDFSKIYPEIIFNTK